MYDFACEKDYGKFLPEIKRLLTWFLKKSIWLPVTNFFMMESANRSSKICFPSLFFSQRWSQSMSLQSEYCAGGISMDLKESHRLHSNVC
jgi:hypothetical protein